MSDIQRWDIDLSNGDPFKSENGDWIEYADHLAAVAAARADAVDAEFEPRAATERRAYAAGVKAAREAVAAAMTKRGGYHSASEFSAVVLAAIDALLKEKP